MTFNRGKLAISKGALLVTLLFLSFSEISYGQVFINEIVSSNSNVISDPDFDDSGDWIELFNASNQELDLTGYFLTDNLGNEDKWEFPNNTLISANGFLLVWADGEDTLLHTSFKLTKDGEEVGIYDPTGVLLDSIVYANQLTDISYGRIGDGSSDIGFFTEPTPGTSNLTQAYEGIVFERPYFSQKGGFFDSSITLELSSENGQIFYSLDGSQPTMNSNFYTEPLEINESTIVRASVFRSNMIPSKAATNSYFIDENLEDRKLPIVSIATNAEHFWDPDIGIYVQDFKPTWRYPINIEIFENDGGNRASVNELAGVKINGQNSWQLPQKMLGISFDNEYDQNNLEYPLFNDRKRNKFDGFALRASGSDWSFTMMRDGLTQAISKGNTELGQTGFKASIVFVNGEYMGIHNIRSKVDEGFIEENFKLDGSEYDLIENNGVVEQGDDDAFDELFDLLYQDLSVQENYEAVKAFMDVENCMDFFITEMWTSNRSYGHNIQFWKPKAEGTKWKWIAQDFDRSFLGLHNDKMDYFLVDGQFVYNWVARAFESLLENEEFAEGFVKRFADHLFTTYSSERADGYVDLFRSQIVAEMPMHIDRWEGGTSVYGNAIPSYEQWEDEVAIIRNFIHERPEVLYKNLEEHFILPNRIDLGFLCQTDRAGSLTINDLPIPRLNWMGQYFQEVPAQVRVTPNAGHDFIGWSEVIVEDLITAGAVWKYQDNGNDLGDDWKDLDYNDASWSSGPAQLGFGEGDENTEISFGSSSSDKHMTTYFRKTINIENIEDYADLILIDLLRDDGAIIYINGVEVIRSNISAGEISFDKGASWGMDSESENVFLPFVIEKSNLIEGQNVIAVRIHQREPTSSDLSFDMALTAYKYDNANIVSTNNVLDLNLTESKVFSAVFEKTSNCILPDSVFTNLQLSISCSPYLVPEHLTIMPYADLVIDPGVELHFSESAGLKVLGSLTVNGTEDMPVIFQANEANGDSIWGQLYFENTTAPSLLKGLEIIDASEGIHPLKQTAAISAWNSTLEIENLIIEDVHSNPILGRYSDIYLSNSSLHSKVTGDLINVKYGYGEIDNCDFRGNDQVDTDAIDYDEVEDGIIRNSKIYNFLGFNSDGIDLGEESKDVLLENNFIHHITDKGISIGQRSNIILKNSTLVECDQAVRVKDQSSAVLDQVTMYNNSSDVVALEKNIGRGGGTIQVKNSIFSNTALDPVLKDDHSFIDVEYSLSDTDTIEGQNLIFDDPYFVNPTHNEFDLLSQSPAIGAGSNGMINMGSSDHRYSQPASVVIEAIHYHPLIDIELEFLRLYNPHNEAIDLSNFSLSSAIVYEFPEGTTIMPFEKIYIVRDLSLHTDLAHQVHQWSEGRLSNEGEQIILRDDKGILIDHVTYSNLLPWAASADGLGDYLLLMDANLDNHFAKNWIAQPYGLTAIPEIDESSFHVFPNPSTGIFELESNREKLESVKVADAFGRIVHHHSYDQFSVELDLRSLPAGVYYLRINETESKRLVIVK